MLTTNRQTSNGPNLIQQAQHPPARWSEPAAASSSAIRLILVSLKSPASSFADAITSLRFRDKRTYWQAYGRLNYPRRKIYQHWRAQETSAHLRDTIVHLFLKSNDLGISIAFGMATGKPPITVRLSLLISVISDLKEHLGDIGEQHSAVRQPRFNSANDLELETHRQTSQVGERTLLHRFLKSSDGELLSINAMATSKPPIASDHL